jgi:hypothetical protein
MGQMVLTISDLGSFTQHSSSSLNRCLGLDKSTAPALCLEELFLEGWIHFM